MPAPPPKKARRLAAVPAAPPPYDPAPDLAALREVFDAVTEAEPTLKRAVEALALADDIDGVLELVARVTDLKELVVAMDRLVGEAAVAVVPSTREKFPLPGGGTFRVSQASAKKRFDNAGIQTAVAGAITKTLNLQAVVTADGEAGDPGEVIAGVVRTVAKACGATVDSFTGWRTGVAKELGISLASFTTFEDGALRPVVESRHDDA